MVSKQEADWRERSRRRFLTAKVWMLGGGVVIFATPVAANVAYRAECFTLGDAMCWPAMGGMAAMTVGILLVCEDIILTRRDRKARRDGPRL